MDNRATEAATKLSSAPFAAQAIRRGLARRYLAYPDVNWALLDQGVVSAANFITNIILARQLGLRGFGVFSLAWFTVLFVNSIQAAMVLTPMMSIGPKQEAREQDEYYTSVLAQQAMFSGLVFVAILVTVLVASLVRPDWGLHGLGLPLAFVALSFQLQSFLRRFLFVRAAPHEAFANDCLSCLGQLVVLLGLAYVGALTVTSALWTVAGTSALAFVVGFRHFGPLRWDPAVFRRVTDRHWRFAKWITIAAVIQGFSGNQLFTIVGAAILGPGAAGAMRASQNIVAVLNIPFQGLENVVPIEAARRYQIQGRQALARYLKRVVTVGGVLTVAFVVFLTVFSETWLALFYGPEFAGYGSVLRWYGAVYVLVFLGTPLTAALRAFERTKPLFWAVAGGTTVSLVAVYPLIHLWGVNGAMLGMFLSFLALHTIHALAAVDCFRDPRRALN